MSTIRLWNTDMEWLASQTDCPATPYGKEQITIPGTGIVPAIVLTHMREGAGDLYITIDLTDEEFANLHYLRRRRGGKITKIEREERFCECRQNRIITTLIEWANPIVLASGL